MIMKKTYFTPDSAAIEMQEEQMIAVSPLNVGVSEDKVNANEALSNSKDMWGNSNIWE